MCWPPEPRQRVHIERLQPARSCRRRVAASGSVADEAIKVIRQAALSHLSTTSDRYRKVGARSTLREFIIPFGTTGYILRFDFRTQELVLVIGARDQREEDFH